jgi:ComF family protein
MRSPDSLDLWEPVLPDASGSGDLACAAAEEAGRALPRLRLQAIAHSLTRALPRALGPAAARTARAAVGLIYPPTCMACGQATADPHALCAGCWGAMGFITRPFCERLGTPFALDIGGALLSPAAMADPPVFSRARAVARHDGPARDLVLRLKFNDRPELSRLMAGLMVQAGAELLAEADILVPVPLHRFRLWSRRFNQSMLLARLIGRAQGLPVLTNALQRVKRTRPQVGLSRPQRADNLQGALRTAPGAELHLRDRRVLLIDDVLTTGATANACARALLRAGASGVDMLTFSRVCGPT